MKIKLPVIWSYRGFIEIEAKSIKEAIKKFDAQKYPKKHQLPKNYYIKRSYELLGEDREKSARRYN